MTVDSGLLIAQDEVTYDAGTGSIAPDSAILSASSLVIAGGTVVDVGTIDAAIDLGGGTLLTAGTLANAITVAGGSEVCAERTA